MASKSHTSPNQTVRLLLLSLLPFVTLGLGWQLGAQDQHRKFQSIYDDMRNVNVDVGSGQLITNPEEQVDIGLLWRVWNVLIEEYIDPSALQVQPMVYGAVSGLVEGLEDPYTVFMTPKQNTDFRDALSGTLEGIGAELSLRDGVVVIVAPLRNSPAAEAGLMPEDVIIEVDGVPVDGDSLFETVARVRGPKGSSVTLKVLREGEDELMTFTIVRDEITVPSMESAMHETESGQVLQITVNQFGENTTEEVQKAMDTYDDGNLAGIIIDVRFNGGGYLDRAVDLTSMFLRQGKVVSVQRRSGDPLVHYVNGRPIDTETPLVILVNAGSASASEIFAGALQDHKRATVIGQTTFGKGTVQEIFEMPDGSSLRLTVARWITPNGRDLGKEGVEPDITVDRTVEDMENERDPQLDAALEFLATGEVVNVPTGSGSAAGDDQ